MFVAQEIQNFGMLNAFWILSVQGDRLIDQVWV